MSIRVIGSLGSVIAANSISLPRAVPAGRHMMAWSYLDTFFYGQAPVSDARLNQWLGAGNSGNLPQNCCQIDIGTVNAEALQVGDLLTVTPPGLAVTRIFAAAEFSGCRWDIDYGTLFSGSSDMQDEGTTAAVDSLLLTYVYKSMLAVATIAIRRTTAQPAVTFTPTVTGWTALHDLAATAGGNEYILKTYWKIIHGQLPIGTTEVNFTGTLNAAGYDWFAHVRTLYSEPSGGSDCIHTRGGAFLRTWADFSDNIWVARNERGLPDTLVSVQVTSSNTDIYPTILTESSGRIRLLFTRNNVDLCECYSDDDGTTWSTPTVAISWCRHGRAAIDRATGAIVRTGLNTKSKLSALGLSYNPFKATIQYPGDSAATATGVTAGANIADEPFALESGRDLQARLRLAYREDTYGIKTYGRVRDWESFNTGVSYAVKV